MPKTKLTPKQLFERRNTDDVFDREVVVGLLRVLNRKLVYQQVWNDDENGIESVTVPFFYDFGGSAQSTERFIQDNYTFFTSDECTEIGLRKIDGNFDFYPQGRVSLGGVSIDSGNITNRFAMAKYTKIVDGKPKAFTSFLYSMPLQFQFSLEVRAENMTTAFKIDQACREFFYKNKTFRFNYRGLVVPARVGFPENALNLSPGSTYVMGAAPQENYVTLKMSVQVETYQPVFDPYSEIPADATMSPVGANIWVNNRPGSTPKRTGPLTIKTPLKDAVLVSGQDLMLEWDYDYLDRDLLAVDVLVETKDGETVVASVDNHNFYHWRIPEDFSGNGSVDLAVLNSETVSVATAPEVLVWPDPETGIVEPENYLVRNPGFFIVPSPDYKVPAVLSYEDRDGKLTETPCELNLDNYSIAPEGGLSFKCFVYDADVSSVRARLKVRDHFQPENQAESDWFTII